METSRLIHISRADYLAVLREETESIATAVRAAACELSSQFFARQMSRQYSLGSGPLAADGGGVDPNEAVRALATFALGGEPAPERVAELEQFLGALGGTVTDDRVKAMLCLIGAMPEYQLC
jgi:hypothetical protein